MVPVNAVLGVERSEVRAARNAARAGEVEFPVRARAAAARHKRCFVRHRLATATPNGDVLAVVAHELRNPLTPIRMVATLLEDAGTDPAMLQHLRDVIERQVAHMTRLVDDLLDASRIANGKLRLERRAVDLADILAATADGFHCSTQARRLRLELRLPRGAASIDGDPVRLAQVFGNLVDNACKFTPEGGEVVVSLAMRANEAVVTVSDSGIGMTADEIDEVFEPYAQAQRSAGLSRGGLGIGLSLVRDIVEAHGGTVRASSPGRGLGSRFVVTLPVASNAAPMYAEAA